MTVAVVAEGHPVDPVHPVGGGGRGQDGRMDRMAEFSGARIHPVPRAVAARTGEMDP